MWLRANNMLKRLMDVIVSLVALIALLPIWIVVPVLIKCDSKGPVFFIQNRLTKDGRQFRMYKFRSMTDARDENGHLLPDEARLPQFGRILRSTSLDELPELINIFKGDMSIVGPRPLLVKYLPLYNDFQKHRHDVTPGLTGWAQVNGRNALSWEKKFELDVWYAKNISFAMDVKIVLMTVMKVFRREGISSETAATMEEFRGEAVAHE